MNLAAMLAADEDALICDFAEYYHIYNMQELPVSYAATLACGLGTESRIMSAMTGKKLNTDTHLLAVIADALRWLRWTKTKDGQKNRNAPESIELKMLGIGKDKNVAAFTTADEFEKQRKKILRGIKHGN